MSTETHHDIASVTKMVVTTALMRLVSLGLLSLDDPVRRYVPGFADGGKSTVTIRDLLLHRAGLVEWYPFYLTVGEGDADAAYRFMDTMPLRYRPRTGRHYSDVGFMLLGRIMSHVTAQPLDEAITTLITGPLGMNCTAFAKPVGQPVSTSSYGDHAEMTMVRLGNANLRGEERSHFGRWRESPVQGAVNDGNAFHVFSGTSGHAGLFSTLHDLNALAVALASLDEHEDLWQPEIAREFFAAGPDPEQALGFRSYSMALGGEQVTVLGHPGYTGCAVGFVPGRGIAVELMSNRLLTHGVPIPTETLFQQALEAASAVLGDRAA